MCSSSVMGHFQKVPIENLLLDFEVLFFSQLKKKVKVLALYSLDY